MCRLRNPDESRRVENQYGAAIAQFGSPGHADNLNQWIGGLTDDDLTQSQDALAPQSDRKAGSYPEHKHLFASFGQVKKRGQAEQRQHPAPKRDDLVILKNLHRARFDLNDLTDGHLRNGEGLSSQANDKGIRDR